MKLGRLATVTVPTEPRGWETRGLRIEACEVGVLFTKKGEDGLTLVVTAITDLKYRPKKTGAGKIVIPEKSRLRAEEAIEHYANLISVSRHTRRTLSSPHPAVVLIPEDDADALFLTESSGFLEKVGNRGVPGATYELDIDVHIDLLVDRLDGVALVAEALCHSHATGCFHEAVRLFERAFGVSGRQLIQPLSNFLSTSNRGYTNEEIESWIDMRDGVTHADQRNEILFEADVAWIVERVLQASYDILLNKVTWRNPSTDRREAWAPACGTSSPDCNLFVTQGLGANLKFRLFDEFRRFPLNLNGVLTGLPEGWWTGKPGGQPHPPI